MALKGKAMSYEYGSYSKEEDVLRVCDHAGQVGKYCPMCGNRKIGSETIMGDYHFGCFFVKERKSVPCSHIGQSGGHCSMCGAKRKNLLDLY